MRWSGELLWTLVAHRLDLRYKETLLGIGWLLLQPVSLTIIFTYIRRIANIPVGDTPYPLFVASGLLAWSFTALVVSQSTSCITTYGAVLKRVAFQKILLPISVVIVSLVDLGIMLGLVGILFVYYKIAVPWEAAWVLLPLLVHLALLLGLSCLVSLGLVFLRDIGFATNSILQLWFLASPVFYPSSMVPTEFKEIARWNPMTGIIEGYRSALLFGQPPSMETFGPALIVSVAMLVVGFLLFRWLEGILVDML